MADTVTFDDPELVEKTAREIGAAFEGMFYPGWDSLTIFDQRLYRRYAARVLAKVGPDLYERGRLDGAAMEAAEAKAREESARRPRQSLSYAYGIAPDAALAAVDRAIIPTGGRS